MDDGRIKESPRAGMDRLSPAFPAVRAALSREIERERFAGLSFGVVNDEGLAARFGFGSGNPTERTVYRVGSVTKVFAGLALLRLRDEGLISLDDPASRILPELGAIRCPFADGKTITLRHLVTHSSGLPRTGALDFTRGEPPIREDELLAQLSGIRLDFAPGTRAGYSNLGMALVGVIIARVCGSTFRDFLQVGILDPLAMTSTCWEAAGVPEGRLAPGRLKMGNTFEPGVSEWRLGAAEAAGGLYSTVEDLAKFLRFELSAWTSHDGGESSVLQRSSLRESQCVAGPVGDAPPAFGVNWKIESEDGPSQTVYHDGATDDYSACIFMKPRLGLAVVALANSGDVDRLIEVTRDQLGILAAALT